MKLTIQQINDRLAPKGFTLTGPYTNLETRTTFRCNNGHKFSVLPSSLLHRDAKCPACNTRTIHGIGINDLQERSSPYSRRWYGIFKRCHNHSANPAYIDVAICEEWYTLSNFKAWMQTQDWKNKELDKDIIIPGNRVYHPAGCCFVPSWLNNMFMTKPQRDLPQGVWQTPSGNYQAEISKNNRNIKLGTFKTIEEASVTYIEARICILVDAINRIDDPRIKKGIEKHITLLNA